jgi:ankyrin repeat protein
MQIHLAAKRGDNRAIERFLRRGVHADATDNEGKTPLMYAAEGRRSSLATLELLIDCGANTNAVSKSLHDTPLTLAARSGKPERVRLLLNAGADPHVVSDSGYTAITNIPAYNDAGHMAVLELLLEAGADPNVISTYSLPVQTWKPAMRRAPRPCSSPADAVDLPESQS